MNTQTVKANTGNGLQRALRTATRLLKAKTVKDQRTRELCVCLEVIGDNGDCVVHGPGLERAADACWRCGGRGEVRNEGFVWVACPLCTCAICGELPGAHHVGGHEFHR